MRCNKCGKTIRMENGVAKQDYVFVRKNWGYFSTKDGKTQEFVLCEDCVEEMEKDFSIPSLVTDTIELI